MSNWTTRSTLIGVDVFNLLFQSLCCYLLTSIYQGSQHKKNQQIYLINLSMVEIFANSFLLVRDVVNLRRLHPDNSTGVYDTVFWCMNMLYVTGISYVYILAMFYITGDRLGLILCSLKYKWFMNIKKAKKLITWTWVISISIGFFFCLLTYFKFDYVRNKAKISKIMAVYVLSSFYVLYLVFAVISYILIFAKYLITERRLSTSQGENRAVITNQHRPRFTLCILLVITYVVLTVLPSLTRAGLYIRGTQFPYAITYWYLISIRISYTVDGVLYVFIQKKVQRVFWNKVSSKRQQQAHIEEIRMYGTATSRPAQSRDRIGTNF